MLEKKNLRPNIIIIHDINDFMPGVQKYPSLTLSFTFD